GKRGRRIPSAAERRIAAGEWRSSDRLDHFCGSKRRSRPISRETKEYRWRRWRNARVLLPAAQDPRVHSAKWRYKCLREQKAPPFVLRPGARETGPRLVANADRQHCP